jgi:hypothetical protein
METRALKYLLAVGVAMLMASWSTIAWAMRCEDWGCGTNHNETLVRNPR